MTGPVLHMAPLRRQRFRRLRYWWWLHWQARHWIAVGATTDDPEDD